MLNRDRLREALATLDAALKYRAPRKPPEGVPFEVWAREVMNAPKGAT